MMECSGTISSVEYQGVYVKSDVRVRVRGDAYGRVEVRGENE